MMGNLLFELPALATVKLNVETTNNLVFYSSHAFNSGPNRFVPFEYQTSLVFRSPL